MMKKSLPHITWNNIAPPYYEYKYFDGCDSIPFHPTAQAFELANAWRLCEIATLAYAEESFVRPRLETLGVSDMAYFDGQSTDCFVASHEEWIVVAFRGTESRPRAEAPYDFQHILADVRTDCNIRLVQAAHKGKIHQGFREALDEVWEPLQTSLRNMLHHKSRPLWITGHSLGAALATVAAERYSDAIQGVYTFGSPRVGDSDFAEYVSTLNIYRVVHHNDIVTKVPFPGLYCHVGEQWYLDSGGKLHRKIPLLERLLDYLCGKAKNLTRTVEQISQGTFTYVPGALKDHTPILYATHLRNNLGRSYELM